MLCSLCPIAVIFFSISVRRNSRELFLISMFVSFEFILVSSEYICINIMSLSLHSFVTFSITWRRRQAVSEKDILAQYTYSIKHRMMSRRSALIFLKHVDRCPTCKSSQFTLHITHTVHAIQVSFVHWSHRYIQSQIDIMTSRAQNHKKNQYAKNIGTTGS